MTRINAVYLIAGIVIGLLVMVLFNSFQPEPKNNEAVLKKGIEQRDERIKELVDSRKSDLKERDSIKKEYLYLQDRKEKVNTVYVKEYIAVDRADIRGKDSILRANIGL